MGPFRCPSCDHFIGRERVSRGGSLRHPGRPMPFKGFVACRCLLCHVVVHRHRAFFRTGTVTGIGTGNDSKKQRPCVESLDGEKVRGYEEKVDRNMTQHKHDISIIPQFTPAGGRHHLIMSLMKCMIIGLPIIFSGCISIQGPSSGDMKRELLNSYLVKAAKRFYPEGAPRDTSRIYPRLHGQNLAPIEDELNDIASGLRKAHKAKFGTISAYAMPKMKEQVSSQIEVISEQPIAANTDQNGRITIDVRVLQSIFRGAVLETFQRDHPSIKLHPTLEHRFDRTYDPGTVTADQVAAIEQLLELVEKIEKMPSHYSAIGDMFDVFSNDKRLGQQPWFELEEIEMSSLSLQARHGGAVSFLLAHEQAHLVLDHHSRWNHLVGDEKTRCDARRSFEAEADAYALLLLSPQTTAGGAGMVFFEAPGWDTFSNMVGFRNFLIFGYNLSGFNESEGKTCKYETNQVRFQRLEKLNKFIQETH
jgi:hypothetical protein